MNMISNAVSSVTTNAGTISFVVAGGILGRKVIQASGCKIAAMVASEMGKPSAAEWNKASQNYLSQVRKDAFRDLTAVAGFGVLGLTTDYLNKEQKPAETIKPEPTFLENYGKPIAITTVSVGAGLVALNEMRVLLGGTPLRNMAGGNVPQKPVQSPLTKSFGWPFGGIKFK